MSTVEADQKTRKPAGAAGGAGGQFATKAHTPPEETLAENASGSFLFPPESFDNFDEYVRFFMEAPISDRVLSNAGHAYIAWRKRSILKHIHARSEQQSGDINSRVYKASRRGTEAYNKVLAEEQAKWRAEAEALHPIKKLPYSGSRTILRSHQIVKLRGILPDEDDQRALDYPMSLLNEELTAADIFDRYHAGEWASDALTESDFAQSEATRRVASLLAQQQGLYDYDEFY